jgi:hypothetical protein
MPDIGYDFNARMRASAEFHRQLDIGRSFIERTTQLRDWFFTFHQLVVDDDNDIFNHPYDEQYIIAQLAQLRDEFQALVDSFGGMP